jgi:hypothetical protein
MIKAQILNQINNSNDCMAIAIELRKIGYKASETSIRSAIVRCGAVLVTPHYLDAISAVTGISRDELIELEIEKA